MGWMPVCLGGINIPRRVNTQKLTGDGVWPSKMGRNTHVGMLLTAAWGSIQHTQRAGRYSLQLEVMLQIRAMPFSSCSQSCFYYYMSLGIVGYCTPLAVEDQCSVCSPALGYGTPLPACSVRSATEENWAGAQKKKKFPFSFLRVQDTVCRVLFSVTAESACQVTRMEKFLVFW